MKSEAICCNIQSTEEKILYKLVKDFVQSSLPIGTLLLSLNPTRLDQENKCFSKELSAKEVILMIQNTSSSSMTRHCILSEDRKYSICCKRCF